MTNAELGTIVSIYMWMFFASILTGPSLVVACALGGFVIGVAWNTLDNYDKLKAKK